MTEPIQFGELKCAQLGLMRDARFVFRFRFRVSIRQSHRRQRLSGVSLMLLLLRSTVGGNRESWIVVICCTGSFLRLT
jgi:hypothetical protein